MYSHKNLLRHPSVMTRNTGYSDEMMYKQAKLLYDIVFQTTQVKVGRGKKAHFVSQRKYQVEESVDNKAIKSLEYYKLKMELYFCFV